MIKGGVSRRWLQCRVGIDRRARCSAVRVEADLFAGIHASLILCYSEENAKGVATQNWGVPEARGRIFASDVQRWCDIFIFCAFGSRWVRLRRSLSAYNVEVAF